METNSKEYVIQFQPKCINIPYKKQKMSMYLEVQSASKAGGKKMKKYTS
jgi:hypothetical protein